MAQINMRTGVLIGMIFELGIVAMWAESNSLSIDAGQFPVGFRVIRTHDATRPSLTGEADAGRAMQIAIWYPAKRAGAPRMSLRDYVVLDAQAVRFATPDEQRRQETIERFEKDPLAAGVSRESLEKLLDMRSAAVFDAPAAKGKFPVLLFLHAAPENQNLISEFLASHGYVVAGVKSKGTDQIDYRLSVPNLVTMQADARFVLQQIEKLPFAETQRIGLIGMSNGALGAAGLAMSMREVRAIVSLDGTIAEQAAGKALPQFEVYDPEGFRGGILHLYTPDGNPYLQLEQLQRFKNAQTYLVRMPKMRHADFLAYGVFEKFVPGIRGTTTLDTYTAFTFVSRYSLYFLDYFLKHDKKALQRLTREPARNGVPARMLTVARYP
jgi:hypothetical protein